MWETKLTIRTALTILFAEILMFYTTTHSITGLSRMIAWREIIHMITVRLLFQLYFATVHRPDTVLLLLLSGWCIIPHWLLCWNICCFLLCKVIHLVVTINVMGHCKPSGATFYIGFFSHHLYIHKTGHLCT